MQRIEIVRQVQHVHFDRSPSGRPRPLRFILNFSPALKTLADEPPGMTAFNLRGGRPARAKAAAKGLVKNQFAQVALPTSTS
jgi:hypothetical protein